MRRPAVLKRGLSGRQLASVIGAVFGLAYVEANASGLGQPGSLEVRIVGASAFVACLSLLRRGLRRDPTRPAEPGRAEPRRFGPRYWLVVVGEAVALFVGWYALSGPLGRPEAALPWVTLVVGVHFFALALVFRARIQHALGAALTACGAAGMALALSDARASSVAMAAGVVPGFVLLAFSFWGLTGSGRTVATDTTQGTGDQPRDGRPTAVQPMKVLASRGKCGGDS